MPHSLYPLDASTPVFPYGYQSQQGLALQNGMPSNAETQFSMNPLNAALRRNPSMHLPHLDGFGDPAALQVIEKETCHQSQYILDGLLLHILIIARILFFRPQPCGKTTFKVLCRWDMVRISSRTFKVSRISRKVWLSIKFW
jgi:hypothetical protein